MLEVLFPLLLSPYQCYKMVRKVCSVLKCDGSWQLNNQISILGSDSKLPNVKRRDKIQFVTFDMFDKITLRGGDTSSSDYLHIYPRKESNGHQKKMPSLPTHGSPQPLATGNATYTPMAEDAGRSDATGTMPKDGK